MDTREVVMPDTMPLERLEAEITQLAGHLAAGECRWLQLVSKQHGISCVLMHAVRVVPRDLSTGSECNERRRVGGDGGVVHGEWSCGPHWC